MRSGLVQTGAWAVATTAAVLLSWLGVSSVLSDAAFDPPATLALPGSATPAASGGVGTSSPDATLPDPPSDPPSGTAPSPSTPPRSASPARRTTGPTGGAAQPQQPAQPQASTVHSYLVPGGRVALDEHPDRADLVSATPDAGWQMQMWNGDQWMRIDFSRDGATNSVFVTWNGHAPDVQTVVR
ncbi:hypothetical protein C7C46_07955 [Streptomyces tateyamensis]|uniref:Secreted protein n=1 Tax=Streptomyces tateyamensis TaxID=565073 RepID=A0A2V4NP83_9ACTN|nr:hypothetical protein [Streptomyces tateyamensis]PYC84408.1 hypothetical protein C7C46_07955 [Streptomyces tateyamensis]